MQRIYFLYSGFFKYQRLYVDIYLQKKSVDRTFINHYFNKLKEEPITPKFNSNIFLV